MYGKPIKVEGPTLHDPDKPKTPLPFVLSVLFFVLLKT